MSLWQLVQVGTAKRWGWWQFLHSACVGPRSLTLWTLAAWHVLHRDHHAAPAPGGAACGWWHWVHWCLLPIALATSGAWHSLQAFLFRASCGW
jgi:hypothetical protein